MTASVYQYTTVPDTYLCPANSPDSDRDGLCDAAEAHYGTNPNNPDTDGDGFNDAVEVYGVAGVDFKHYGASPIHKDVFVYVNYYIQPAQLAFDTVVKSFANAPLGSPDGTTGINLHVIMGGQIDQQYQNANIKGPLKGDFTQFDTIKNMYLPQRWVQIAHYALFANQFDSSHYSGVSDGYPSHDLPHHARSQWRNRAAADGHLHARAGTQPRSSAWRQRE